jgi:short-subunit dehydrogenase
MAFRCFDLKFASLGVRFRTVILGPMRTEMWEGKENALVPSAQKVAKKIVHFTVSGRTRLFYPFLTTTLLRLSLFLPDRVFALVSARVLK